MNHVPTFDFFDAETLIAPFAFYAQAHRSHPVIKVEDRDWYCVFSSELVKEVIRRVEDFSSDFGDVTGGTRAEDPEIKAAAQGGHPTLNTLVTADAPLHTASRKLVNKAFSKPLIDAMEADIRAIAEALIDRAEPGKPFDLVNDFAIPFPIEVIRNMLGMQEADPVDMKRWSVAVLDRSGGLIDRERELECARDIVDFQKTTMEIIARRRSRKQDDLISELVDGQMEGGRPITDLEVLAIIMQLMPAGNETSTVGITRGMALLIAHPDQQRLARADFGLIPNMIEEILRIEAPAQAIMRRTRHATVLGGVELPAGVMIWGGIGAANRDPAAFDDPDAFDIRRRGAADHLSFGRGIHSCLGNMLARKEMLVAFETIFTRWKNVRLAPGASLTITPHIANPGVGPLQIEFERG